MRAFLTATLTVLAIVAAVPSVLLLFVAKKFDKALVDDMLTWTYDKPKYQ